MFYRLSILFIITFFSHHKTAYSQSEIKGKILDLETHQPIEGVYISGKNKMIFTISDTLGRFEIETKAKNDILYFSHLSYKTKQFIIKNDNFLKVNLEKTEKTLKSITVNGYRQESQRNNLEKVRIELKDIEQRPIALGIKDPLKLITNQAGAYAGNDVNTGIFVRGSETSHNRFTLDEIPVHVPNHMFNFISVFNADVIEYLDFYKESKSSSDGGALSSFVKTKVQSEIKNDFKLKGSIGLIFADLYSDIPVYKDKLSISLGARTSYFQYIKKLIDATQKGKKSDFEIPHYSVGDMNLKVNYKPKENEKLSLHIFYSSDNLKLNNNKINANWSNFITSFSHEKELSSSLSWNSNLGISKGKSKIHNRDNRLDSNLESYHFSSHLSWEIKENFQLKLTAFADFIQNNKNTGIEETKTDQNETSTKNKKEKLGIYGVGLDQSWNITESLILTTGLRTSFYSTKKILPKPRISVRYHLLDNLNFRFNYARQSQAQHLQSPLELNLPLQVVFLSDKEVPIQESDLFNLGGEYLINDNMRFYASVYLRKLYNQSLYKTGVDLSSQPIFANSLSFGTGETKGVELSIKGNIKKLNLSVNYTNGISSRVFDDINEGEELHPYQDIRHQLNLGAFYKINKKWDISLSWFYNSGAPFTLPTQGAYYQGINYLEDPLFSPFTKINLTSDYLQAIAWISL